MNKTVFLNAGHGGSDPGAAANGFKEKDLNLSIAVSCRDELLRHSVNVIMAREKDTDLTSSEIIKMCNSSNASLAVDIHNNAGKGDGAEVYYYSGGGVSKELAEAVLAEIVKLGQNSRGIKTRASEDGSDYYYFIRETVPPAVIVECAFVDNREDMKIIDTKAEQQAMGKAIAKGILKVLEIPFKKETAVQKENFEVASVQALLRQAYAQGIVKTLVKTIDNKESVITKSAISEAKKYLGMKSTDASLSLKFIADLERAIDILRKAKEDDLKASLKGDINGDGKVNIKDATALQKQIAGIE